VRDACSEVCCVTCPAVYCEVSVSPTVPAKNAVVNVDVGIVGELAVLEFGRSFFCERPQCFDHISSLCGENLGAVFHVDCGM